MKYFPIAWLGLWSVAAFTMMSEAAGFSLGETNLTLSPASVITSVVLTADSPTDTWTATANTNWLNLVTCGKGTNTNSTTVVFGVQSHVGTARTGTLTIAGLTLSVAQQGAGTATTLAATDVGITNATFHGAVVPNADDTEGYFQYSTNGGWLVDTVCTGISEYCSVRAALSQGPDGTFYICNPDCNRIYKIAATGGVCAVPPPGFSWNGSSRAIVDEDNNLYVSELWSIRKYTAATETWSVFAGDPYVTQQSVDGVGTAARFRTILGMVRDSVGNFYVSCMYNIRHVTTNAVVTTLTDQGTAVGQRDGPAFGPPDTVALIDAASGVAVDDYSGRLYWSEYSPGYSICIRMLNLNGPGMVTTLTGGEAGFADGTGTVARFNYPTQILVDKDSDLFVIDAIVNDAIRKVTPEGVVTTLSFLDARTGSPFVFNNLGGGMLDSSNNLVVIDYGGNAIRRVGYRLLDPVTVASQSGLSGTNAVGFTNTVSGLFPGTKYYYWSVAANSVSTNPGEMFSFTTLQATTTLVLASAPNPASYGEDLTLTATVFTNAPGWYAASGTVIFKDGGVAIGTGALAGGVAVFITNRLSLGSHSLSAEYPGDAHYHGSSTVLPITQTITQGVPNVTVWPTASALVYGQTLAFSTLSNVTVTPSGTFAWVDGGTAPDIGVSSHDVVFTPDDTLNYINVTGSVSVTVNKSPSTVTEWPTASAIALGELLSASTLSGGVTAPAGSFAWISPDHRPAGGTAPQGVTFTPGDTNRYLPTNGTVSVTVNAAPTTNTLTVSRNPSAENESVTFSVTVSTISPNVFVPDGAITLKDGAVSLATLTLGGGAAAFTTNRLSPGAHSISAVYDGNASFLGSTSSPALLQTVYPELAVLQNPDTNAAALSGRVINNQQTVAAVFKVGTGNMRLVRAALRLRCDYSGAPPNDSIRCTLYDVTSSNTPNAALAACDSAALNISQSDTSWYSVLFSEDLRDYVLQADHTYALSVSIPTAGTATNRTIKNITPPNTPYTMALGYTFVQNVYSPSASFWFTNSDRFGVILTGAEDPRTPTATSLSANLSTSFYGSVVVAFASTITPAGVSGTVTFMDGSALLGAGAVSGGVATLGTPSLDIGSHDITAEYLGNVMYEPSASAPALAHTVLPPPQVVTLPATEILADGAALFGRVNPNGLTADSFFQYATNAAWQVGTPAGTNNSGNADGIGSAASFNRPAGVAVDGSGDIWVADTFNCRIRRISPAGAVTTLAGTIPGYADGAGGAARFSAPYGLTLDNSNNLIVADTINHCIRKITPAGMVTTLAGTNAYGYADGTGCEARFFRPQGIARDADGNFIVADTRNNRIRKVTPAGIVTTIAGGDTNGYADGVSNTARFYWPGGVTVGSAGRVLVADTGNHCIRQITPGGAVSTLAGTNAQGYADGAGSAARFYSPDGLAVDSLGCVLVADTYNHCIRKISLDGKVTSLTGTNAGYADGSAGMAEFNQPFGLAIDHADTLFVADYQNHCIHKVMNGLVAPVTTVAAQSGLTGTGTTEISRVISGLLPERTCYFQALVTNFSGCCRGAVFNFITSTTSAMDQVSLNFMPASPQSYNTTNTLSVTGGSGSGALSYEVLSGPGIIIGVNELKAISGTGTITVKATKAADINYHAASATAQVACAKADQTILFPAIPDQETNATVNLSATASSGLPVSFAVTSGPAKISGGNTLSFTGAGTVSITAAQSGNSDWHAAPDVASSFEVMSAAQPPEPPAGIAASAGLYLEKVRVTWQAVSGATGYQVWRNTANNSGAASQLGATIATSFDDVGVTTDTTYYYWVKSVNGAGAGAFSAAAAGYPCVVGPLVNVNGMIGNNVRAARGTPIDIAVAMMHMPGAYIGLNVDWWVAAYAHNGGHWYYMNNAMIFMPFDGNLANIQPAYQGPIMDFPPLTIAQDVFLLPGTYNIWFAVDYPMDGVLNMTPGYHLMDCVTVVVE